MFQGEFWFTPDGGFWINVIAGVITAILVSIIVFTFIKLWKFSFVKLAFDRFWGSDNTRRDKTYIVIDLLTNVANPASGRYIYKLKPNTLLTGPTEVVGDCNPRAVQYIATTFAKVTEIDPVARFDTEVQNIWEANLICLGSDASNLKTHAILSHACNKYAQFVDNGDAIKWLPTGDKFTLKDGKDKGLILKVKNPYFKEYWVIVCAGLNVWGSSGAAFYVARHWREIEKRFGRDEFAMIVNVAHRSDESAEEIIATPDSRKPSLLYKLFTCQILNC
ncbi:hypothetical protein KKG66_01255 [bacterium]|nr:hypothetical protein [bacterium]